MAGTAVTAAEYVFRIANDWSPDHALTGQIPTGVGTIPMALGYMALIIMWNRRSSHHIERFRSVGKMALTNYLTQTVLGVTMLTMWWDGVAATESSEERGAVARADNGIARAFKDHDLTSAITPGD